MQSANSSEPEPYYVDPASLSGVPNEIAARLLDAIGSLRDNAPAVLALCQTDQRFYQLCRNTQVQVAPAGPSQSVYDAALSVSREQAGQKHAQRLLVDALVLQLAIADTVPHGHAASIRLAVWGRAPDAIELHVADNHEVRIALGRDLRVPAYLDAYVTDRTDGAVAYVPVLIARAFLTDMLPRVAFINVSNDEILDSPWLAPFRVLRDWLGRASESGAQSAATLRRMLLDDAALRQELQRAVARQPPSAVGLPEVA